MLRKRSQDRFWELFEEYCGDQIAMWSPQPQSSSVQNFGQGCNRCIAYKYVELQLNSAVQPVQNATCQFSVRTTPVNTFWHYRNAKINSAYTVHGHVRTLLRSTAFSICTKCPIISIHMMCDIIICATWSLTSLVCNNWTQSNGYYLI